MNKNKNWKKLKEKIFLNEPEVRTEYNALEDEYIEKCKSIEKRLKERRK